MKNEGEVGKMENGEEKKQKLHQKRDKYPQIASFSDMISNIFRRASRIIYVRWGKSKDLKGRWRRGEGW